MLQSTQRPGGVGSAIKNPDPIPSLCCAKKKKNCDVERRDVCVAMLQIQRNDAKYWVRLVDANLADDGNYTCLVSNELATISRTFAVNIVGKVYVINAHLSLLSGKISIALCKAFVANSLSPILRKVTGLRSKEAQEHLPTTTVPTFSVNRIASNGLGLSWVPCNSNTSLAAPVC